MNNVLFYGVTNMGQIRTNNEDTFVAQHIWDNNHILAVAIDGVGGYEGGEIAADLAQKNIVEYLTNYPNGERVELLRRAVIYANNTIFEERNNKPECENMSCVLTAIIVEVEERRISMAHVGDTRLYQYLHGDIVKLSHDHSLVGYREEVGDLTEEEAMNHPQRNVIGRDVGSEMLEDSDKKYVEVATLPLKALSTLLLCSDGLCDMITSSYMASILSQKSSIEEKAAALIAAANKAGGKDNITVVLVEANIEEDIAPVETETEADNEPQEVVVDQVGAPLVADEGVTDESCGKSRCNWERVTLFVLSYIIVLLSGFLIGYYFQSTTKILDPIINSEGETSEDTTNIDEIVDSLVDDQEPIDESSSDDVGTIENN